MNLSLEELKTQYGEYIINKISTKTYSKYVDSNFDVDGFTYMSYNKYYNSEEHLKLLNIFLRKDKLEKIKRVSK